MGLTFQEQETVITWDRAGDTMNIYTADPYLMARLDKLEHIYKRAKTYRNGGEVVAADYRAESVSVPCAVAIREKQGREIAKVPFISE